MKKWFLLGLVFQTQLVYAGGVTVGNGGDISDSEQLSVQEIESLVGGSKHVLGDIFNTMDLNAVDTQYSRQTPPYFQKLFGANGNLLNAVASAKIELRPTDPCVSLDGKEKDGSAEPDNSSICLSAQRLQRKVTRHDASIKIFALIAHELSHLTGATEEEAVDFQKIIESILTNASTEQWRQFDFVAQGNTDLLRFLYGAVLIAEIGTADWKVACESLTLSDGNLQSLIPKMGAFSRYNSSNYGRISFAYIQNKLSQLYVCKKAGVTITEMDQAIVDLIFLNGPKVFFDEVDPEYLVLWGIVYNLPRDHETLSMIQNDNELINTISALAGYF